LTLAPSLTPRSMASRACFKWSAPLPPRVFFLFFRLFLGFLVSPLCRTSRISIFDHGNLDLIRRSSRARYPLSPASFFVSIRYIAVVLVNRRIITT
jgi:hypothetical protein